MSEAQLRIEAVITCSNASTLALGHGVSAEHFLIKYCGIHGRYYTHIFRRPQSLEADPVYLSYQQSPRLNKGRYLHHDKGVITIYKPSEP